MIPVVVGVLGTFPTGLEKRYVKLEIGGRIKIILTTAFLRTARILRRVLETLGVLLSLRLK